MPTQDTTHRSYAWPVTIALLLVLAAGAWFIYHMDRTRTNNGVLSDQFSWTLTPQAGATGTTTNIQLSIAGVDIPVRSMPGSCVEISKTTWSLLPDELSGVVCRDSSGNGVEIGVFQSGSTLVLKQGTVTGDKRTDFAEIVQQKS